MTIKPETEDWRLSAEIQWKLKRPFKKIKCPTCGGHGEIGGGFAWIGDPEQCPECWGAKYVRDPDDVMEAMPEIPESLVEHMRAAWKEYFDNPFR